MLFTKRLRKGVRRGSITCSVRIWQRPRVAVGKRYRMEEGQIEVDSVVPITLADVTPDLARASGFKGVVDLLKVAKHGRGENVYLVRFHYVRPTAKPKATSKAGSAAVDAYVAAQPSAVQAILRHVRSALRRALPGAEEAISYRIPAFRQHGRVVVYFAAWKEHYSLYPAGARLVEALADQLEPYEVAKGTIRFPYAGRVPSALIGRIARFLAREAADRAAKRAVASTASR